MPFLLSTPERPRLIREAVDCAADPAYALIEAVAAEKSHAQLKDAKIVVACGRGIKKKEDLDMIASLLRASAHHLPAQDHFPTADGCPMRRSSVKAAAP